MNYIVYLTLNKINNKFYIGVHQTTNLAFDGYLGYAIIIDGVMKSMTTLM